MKALSLPSLAIVLFAVVATAGCGSKGDSGSKASGSGPAAAGAGAAAKQGLGSCTNKGSATCKEYYGTLPMLAEDLCKGFDGKGVLAKGNVACAKDNLSGT